MNDNKCYQVKMTIIERTKLWFQEVKNFKSKRNNLAVKEYYWLQRGTDL